MERTNILNDFFNSKSDANEFLEASNQETLEKDFQNWVTKDIGELSILDSANEMCIESLSPEMFEKWEEVKQQLKLNRAMLKKFNYAV
jgi:hypothetical protein